MELTKNGNTTRLDRGADILVSFSSTAAVSITNLSHVRNESQTSNQINAGKATSS